MHNKLHPSHEGLMPIRVLYHNLIRSLENVNPEFLDLTREVIDKEGLDPGLSYKIDEEKVEIPMVGFGKIFIQETMLSYIWCMSFSIAVLYDEAISKRSYNEYFGKIVKPINAKLAEDAYKLWEYGVSLLTHYSEWDRNLPNPEYYPDELEYWIPRINALYLVAMNFVLCHELAHVELAHSRKFVGASDILGLSKQQEIEADDRAIELILKGRNGENDVTIRMGVLIGLCSLLFFNYSTKCEGYPDADDRIDAIMKAIEPDEQDGMWGVANLAFRLWDRHYEKNLDWKDGLNSHKDLYYYIKEQIKNLK